MKMNVCFQWARLPVPRLPRAEIPARRPHTAPTGAVGGDGPAAIANPRRRPATRRVAAPQLTVVAHGAGALLPEDLR